MGAQPNQTVQLSGARKGKNFGGGLRRKQNPLSPQNSLLQPLSMQVTKNTLASPHTKQTHAPAPILADEQTSSRRSKFESARLKDENITLNTEITRRVAEVEAHRRFQSRTTDTANTLEEKMQEKDEEIRRLERQKEGLQKTLEDERAQVYVRLQDSQKLVQQHEQQQMETDMRLRTIKKAHQEELVLLRRQLHNAHSALDQSRQSNQQSPTQSPTEANSAAAASRKATAKTNAQESAQAHTANATSAMETALKELQHKLDSMKREMSIKDRQLANLRTELEEQDQANREGGNTDDYSDVLEEELNMMRVSYERKLREAGDKYDKLAMERIREQNEWERAKKESKHVESGLLIQIESKAKQLDALKKKHSC